MKKIIKKCMVFSLLFTLVGTACPVSAGAKTKKAVNLRTGYTKEIQHRMKKIKYYTEKQAGFSVNDALYPDTIFDKVTNNKVVYHLLWWNSDDGEMPKSSRKKSAKITGKTKFYYANKKRLLSGKKDFLKKLTKTQFLSTMKKYTDVVNIVKQKNGRATLIVLNLHIAD